MRLKERLLQHIEHNVKVRYASMKNLSKMRLNSGIYSEGEVKYYTNSKEEKVQLLTRYYEAHVDTTSLFEDRIYYFSQNKWT